MKRRTFLSAGPLSLLGLGLPVGMIFLSTKQQPDVLHWLRELAQTISAKRRAGAFFWPAGLPEQIKSTNAFLAARTYVTETAGAYFSAAKTHCFYPLMLRRSQAGLLDMLVPVFATDPDGRWQQVLVLTGFQLEALARAAAALAVTDLPLAALLLPLRAIQGSAAGFESRLGRVEMITRTQNGQAQTAIRVQHGDAVVYDVVFQSQHNLTTQSQIA